VSKNNILISWIGLNDIKASQGGSHPGPVLSALQALPFTKAYLLHDTLEGAKSCVKWIGSKAEADIHATSVKLVSPIDFAEIYGAANQLLTEVIGAYPKANVYIHLSPGTPTMQAVWILLGKTANRQVKFVQTSLEQGVQIVEIPFDISAEFQPGSVPVARLLDLSMAEAPRLAQFDSIITRNPGLNLLKKKAAVLAVSDFPVLIEGETGTGKELFALAIHNASNRAEHPFVAVNCGAIPAELIDSELFGHVKGSFTGAVTDKKGYFEAADGGTIFLDEFGELPKAAQVRLLRILQDGSFTRVGDTKEKRVNVRLIAATNRRLLEEIAAGLFREDLFYRVAVGILNLPPLREREGDILLLADAFLQQLAAQIAGGKEKQKKLSVKAKNIIIQHRWPGNARELYATLLRACLWAEADALSDTDIRNAMLETVPAESDILGQPIGKNFDIQAVMSDLAVHYLERAMAEAGGNKTKAAELLGLSSYQTLNNWLDKYGVK
jgi:transcriptional regulator with PAS, ATPase and Fis domain